MSGDLIREEREEKKGLKPNLSEWVRNSRFTGKVGQRAAVFLNS